MASHLQVVLKEDVDHLGHTGEVVRVRPGFARNYLLPRGMACVATRANIKEIEHETKLAQAKAKREKDQARGIAEAMANVTLTVAKPAGEGGRLYGSVTAIEVAELLEAKGHAVDRRKLSMPEEHIKALGSYTIGIRLAGGVEASFTLEVTAAED
ncbi:MAG: 50S ribosomal protein L9 [Deltaproteobacteria bacterium]|nr:50S ribosomal protein L9 [Deltaproteobacteria bacterium]